MAASASCHDFCPLSEARERAARAGGLHVCERGPEARAVKAYRRTAEAASHELRPLHTLVSAQHYLLSEVVIQGGADFYTRVSFVTDRLRAIRQDVVMQQLATHGADRQRVTSLLCNQIRFHVAVGYALSRPRSGEHAAEAAHDTGYDPVMNDDRLMDAALLLQEATRSLDSASRKTAGALQTCVFAACVRLSMALLDASDAAEIIADHAHLHDAPPFDSDFADVHAAAATASASGAAAAAGRAEDGVTAADMRSQTADALQLWSATRACAANFITGRWRDFLLSLGELVGLAGRLQVPADATAAAAARSTASAAATVAGALRSPFQLPSADAFTIRMLLQRYVPIARVQLLRQLSIAMRKGILPAPDVARLLCLQQQKQEHREGTGPSGSSADTPVDAAFEAARLGLRLGLEVSWSVDESSASASLLPAVVGASAPALPADGSSVVVALDATRLADLRVRLAAFPSSGFAVAADGAAVPLPCPDIRIAVDHSRDLDPRLARSDPAMAAAVRPCREDELVGWPARTDVSDVIVALCNFD